VKLDGIGPPASRASFVIWLTLSFLISCIICHCISNTVSNLVEGGESEPEPYRRSRRLRLNAEQVKKFPIGVFDGNHMVYEISKSNDSEIGEHDNLFHPVSDSLNACTICLDEYVVEDKLRCLPCRHAFHAECIAKWLVERSATCPLCKIDLYEDEIDEEGEMDQRNELQHGLFSSGDSVPSEAFTSPTTEMTANEFERSWWRRILNSNLFTIPGQQRRIDAVTRAHEALSEPLLEEQSNNNVPSSGNISDH